MVAGAKLSPLLAAEMAGNTDEATKGMEAVVEARMVPSELPWFSLGSGVLSVFMLFFLYSGLGVESAPWYICCVCI